MKRAFASIAFVFALALSAAAQRGFNFADMMNVRRVAIRSFRRTVVTVAFTVGTVDMPQNRVDHSDLHDKYRRNRA